jgi:DNA topoisomerase VI subunit B
LAKLQRTTFKTSRAAQYVEARALTSMTGQRPAKFADVVAKELMDNALDACETAGVAPKITLAVAEDKVDSSNRITVSDNASGIPPEVVHGALDFNVLVSDKAAYRSPTRGAQGNALKTVFGIPYALGSLEPAIVDARGTRHEVRVWKDPAGELRVQCDDTDLDETSRRDGTAVAVHLPGRVKLDHIRIDPHYWGMVFSLFNPHLEVRIRSFEDGLQARN